MCARVVCRLKAFIRSPCEQVKVNALVCLTKVHGCFGREVLVDAVLPTLRVRACLELFLVGVGGRDGHAIKA